MNVQGLLEIHQLVLGSSCQSFHKERITRKQDSRHKQARREKDLSTNPALGQITHVSKPSHAHAKPASFSRFHGLWLTSLKHLVKPFRLHGSSEARQCKPIHNLSRESCVLLWRHRRHPRLLKAQCAGKKCLKQKCQR